MQGLVARAGQRTNTSARDAAGWIVAIGMLAFLVPASSALAPNVLFFTSHDVGFIAGMLVIVAAAAVSWLLWWAILRLAGRTPARFDAVASALTFVIASFAAANVLGRTLLPMWIAWLPALVIGAAVAQLTRKANAGSVLAVVGTAAAIAPLALAMVNQAPLPPTAAATFSSDERPDVVWVIADELQFPLVMEQDGTVRDEFPNLTALQEQATTYTRAYTPANYTDFAVPALFNGRTDISTLPPDEISAMKASKGILPALSRDYSIVLESPLFTFACESADCRNAAPAAAAGSVQTITTLVADMAAVTGQTSLAQPIASLFPDLRGKWRDFWANDGGARPLIIPAQRVLDRMAQANEADSAAPVLAFWHTMRTHAPWSVDGTGSTLTPHTLPIVPGSHMVGSDEDGHYSTEPLKLLARQMYADSAREFDAELGDLIAGLKAQGRYDDTMIIVTADHGATVNEVQDRRLGDSEVVTWSEIAHVPLIIKAPGQTTPERVTQPRSTGQIAATILQQLTADAPGTVNSPPLDEAPETMVFSHVGVAPMRSLPFPDIPEVDPWTPAMLAGTAPEPVAAPPGARVSDAMLTMLAGDSADAIVVIDGAPMGCIADAALVGSNGMAWRASFTKDGSRGWAVVPRTSAGDYELRCA